MEEYQGSGSNTDDLAECQKFELAVANSEIVEMRESS